MSMSDWRRSLRRSALSAIIDAVFDPLNAFRRLARSSCPLWAVLGEANFVQGPAEASICAARIRLISSSLKW